MKYNERGEEMPDDTPVEMPLHLKRPLTLREEMMRMIRTEMSREAADRGDETFEEADDFDVDEDPDMLSQYEMSEMQEEFRYAEPESIDEQKNKEENKSTVNDDRIKENENGRRNGTGSKVEGLEAESGGKESVADRSGDVRKEHPAVGGKGRSAS